MLKIPNTEFNRSTSKFHFKSFDVQKGKTFSKVRDSFKLKLKQQSDECTHREGEKVFPNYFPLEFDAGKNLTSGVVDRRRHKLFELFR